MIRRIVDAIKGFRVNSFRLIKMCVVLIILLCMIIARMSEMNYEEIKKMPIIIFPDFSIG